MTTIRIDLVNGTLRVSLPRESLADLAARRLANGEIEEELLDPAIFDHERASLLFDDLSGEDGEHHGRKRVGTENGTPIYLEASGVVTYGCGPVPPDNEDPQS